MANKVIRQLPSFHDFLGQEVVVGDVVVYATIDGRSPVQKYATVEKIDEVKSEYDYAREVPHVRVGVREISNGRGFRRWDTYDWKKDGKERQPRITYPMAANIVKVTPNA